MLKHGFADDLPDGHTRGKRRIRILEDHLQLRAQFTHLAFAVMRDVFAVEINFSVGDIVQFQKGPAHGRLSAAGLPHDPEHAAALQFKAHVLHRVHVNLHFARQTLFQRKIFFQMLDFENIFPAVTFFRLHGFSLHIFQIFVHDNLLMSFRITVTRHTMCGAYPNGFGIFARAFFYAFVAALPKIAIIGQIDGVGHIPGYIV